jgi:hypothetical protein
LVMMPSRNSGFRLYHWTAEFPARRKKSVEKTPITHCRNRPRDFGSGSG